MVNTRHRISKQISKEILHTFMLIYTFVYIYLFGKAHKVAATLWPLAIVFYAACIALVIGGGSERLVFLART